MNSRRRILSCALVAVGLVAGCGGDTPGRARNVLLISIDTCRADRLGCYGGSLPTSPHLDRLATEGTLFLQASSTNSVTLPAHASIMTGTLPPVHGVLDNKFRVDASQRTLAEILGERGLDTAAFVSSFMLDARFGLDQGFAHYDDEFASGGAVVVGDKWAINERRAEDTVAAAAAWLAEHGDEPFFAFVHFFDPHAVQDPPEPFATRFAGFPYEGEIAYVDAQIGRLLEILDSLGRADDTLVIVTADHGESLGDHGEDTHSWFVYQSTLHVPLIVRAPGAPAGTVVGEPVSLVDLAPTVLAQLGCAAEAGMLGRDLTPFLDARPAPEAVLPVYAESLAPTLLRAAPLRAVRRGRWKYVESVRPELYDLERDPGELSNRIAEEPALAARLQGELRALLATRRTPGVAANMDSASLERIQSLGYAEGLVRATYAVDPDARDAKDALAIYRKLREAHMLVSKGDLDGAYALCSALTAQQPWLLEAHSMLGGLRFEQGRFAEAAPHFADCVALVDSELAAGAGGLVDAGLAGLLSDLGTCYLELGRFDAAAAAYARSLELSPDDFAVLTAQGTLLAQHQGRFADALDCFRRAVALAPDSAEARCNLGNCLFAMGELSQAAEQYRAALAVAPDLADVHFNLGSVLGELGRHAEALGPLQAAARLAPENHDVQRALGLGLACTGRCDEAREVLRRTLAADPTAAVRLAADVLELAANPVDSARHPEGALCAARALSAAAGERDAKLLELLAVAQAANGDFATALATCERALALAPPAESALRARIERRSEMFREGRPLRLAR